MVWGEKGRWGKGEYMKVLMGSWINKKGTRQDGKALDVGEWTERGRAGLGTG